MSFTITHIHVVAMTIGLIIGVVVMNFLAKKPPKPEGYKPLWDQVINSNADIVTLIGLVMGATLIMTMVFNFQDDIKDEAGYIILAALNPFFYLAGVRNGQQMQGGKTP